MSIRKQFYLACSQCNNQYWSKRLGSFVYGETSPEVRAEAKKDGWQYTRVPNGSMWDICPRCKEANDAHAMRCVEMLVDAIMATRKGK